MTRLMRIGIFTVFILLLLLFSALFLETSETVTFTNSSLLVVLNILFIAGANLGIAVISAKSYLEYGTINLLILSCAVLVMGFGALLASWASVFSINVHTTIFGVSLLVASALQVLVAVVTSAGLDLNQLIRRRISLGIVYIATAFFIVTLTGLSILGYFPAFFTGAGPTSIYRLIFGVSVLFFTIASLILGLLFFQSKSRTLFWCSLALGLIALGVFGSLFIYDFNSSLSWIARGALYTSSFYFFAAFFDPTVKAAGVGFAEKWADAFRPDQKQLSVLFAKMLNAFIYGKSVVNGVGQPVDCLILEVNAAYERITGISREKSVGKKLTTLLPGIQHDPAKWIQNFGQVALTGESMQFENYLRPVKKWFNVSVYSPQKCYFVAMFENVTERKITEHALRVNEEKYRLLFESMSEGFTLNEVIFEMEGKPYDYRILEMNASQEKIIGVSREKIVGQTIRDLDPNAAQKWINIVGEVALSGLPIHLEEYNTHLDKWLQYYAYSPKKGYCAIITTDITERKKAESVAKKAMSALKKERDLFQAVMDGAKRSNLAYLDDNFNFVRVNKAYAESCGCPPNEMIGKNYFTLYSDREHEEIFINVRDSGEPVEFHDTSFIFPDQPERGVTYWDWTLEPVKNSAGNVEGLILSLVETTERKRVEEELRRSEANLAEAQYMAHMGSWEWDISNNKTVWSDEMFRIFNVTPHNPIAKSIISWVHPDDFDLVNNVTRHCITTGQPISIDYRIIRPDGAERVVHTEAKVSSFDLSGKPSKIVGIVQDITERKMLEDKLQNYAKNLERVIEDRTKKLKDAERLAAIGATAGMVGHDIRNPLQAITSDVYLIRTELAYLPQGEEVVNIQECLNEIGKSIDYANKIVSDLQDYARPLMPKFEEVDLCSISQSTISTVNVPETITVKQFIPKDMPKLRIDHLYLRRILQNLTINAIQAMPNGGKLTITANVKDDKVLIHVEDTGEGIPEEVKPKLFTPLFTTKSKGQGFGLAVVKRMTDALGGTITFESEVGKGTKFIVELPISVANEKSLNILSTPSSQGHYT